MHSLPQNAECIIHNNNKNRKKIIANKFKSTTFYAYRKISKYVVCARCARLHCVLLWAMNLAIVDENTILSHTHTHQIGRREFRWIYMGNEYRNAKYERCSHRTELHDEQNAFRFYATCFVFRFGHRDTLSFVSVRNALHSTALNGSSLSLICNEEALRSVCILRSCRDCQIIQQ